MFYVSGFKYDKAGNKLYGITDTDDNVTEFFNKSEIKDIFNTLGYTCIRGAVYTGSDIKFRITTPVIEYIDELPVGSYFGLVFNNSESHKYKKLGVSGALDGWLVEKDDMIRCKLSKKKLIADKENIRRIQAC